MPLKKLWLEQALVDRFHWHLEFTLFQPSADHRDGLATRSGSLDESWAWLKRFGRLAGENDCATLHV